KFGMTSDIRRAANSIAHNIAEGFGRYEPRDKTRFYKISRGSSYELISQLLALNALDYLTEKIMEELTFLCKNVINELDAIIKTQESRKNP
ncbi:MAG: four helix bundle protein, partial [Bacteroidota bacterium]